MPGVVNGDVNGFYRRVWKCISHGTPRPSLSLSVELLQWSGIAGQFKVAVSTDWFSVMCAIEIEGTLPVH